VTAQIGLNIRPRPRVLSYGGGVDSFAALLDSIERGEQPDVCAFVDVSDGDPTKDPTDPGEWPGTYKHIREVVMPLCARLGIRFEWIDSARYPVRDARSLFAWLWARGQIPVAGPKRLCTTIAKVERFEAWMSDTFPRQDVEVWIGFEAGEEGRAENDPNAGVPKRSKQKFNPDAARRHNRFPLIERGLCRCRAVALVRRLGYPVPRKSACMGCCYNSMTDWQTLEREAPEAFNAFAELEARKPPTKAGVKLSITGFKMLKKPPRRPSTLALVDNTGRLYRAPPLREYVKGKARGPKTACSVCGAPERATKATGCGYLEETAP